MYICTVLHLTEPYFTLITWVILSYVRTYIPLLSCSVDLLRRKEEHIRMLEQIQQQEEMLKNKYVRHRMYLWCCTQIAYVH